MSLSQFGYTSAYLSPPSPYTPSHLLPAVSSSSTPSSSSTSSPSMSVPCCEKGTPLTHPHTGHTICSCQYPTTGILPYPRLPLSEPVPPNSYSTIPYGPPTPQSYVPLPPDPSALYQPLNSPYDPKDFGDSWRGLGPTPGCYPYDPTGIPSYPYPNSYGGVDINSAARRKNATRENTNTLKAWLYEHRKNPYPTKGEKIMLAIITKMTLTQVSTWFANARRRLKKENKMTWSPRNKPGDNDDDDDDEDKEKNDNDDSDDDKTMDVNKAASDDSRTDDRDSHSSVDASAPDCSGVRGHPITTQLFDPPHQEGALGSHFSFDGHAHSHHAHPSHGSAMASRPLNFPHPHPQSQHNPHLYQLTSDMQGSPLLQGHKSASIRYSSSTNQNIHSMEGIPDMTLKMESPASSMTRTDSLCPNGNNTGLSEVSNNSCGYSGDASLLDGMRPKIWSLAHEASSDNGYINHASSITTSSSNLIHHNNNNKINCYNNNNMITANNNYHNSNSGSNGGEGIQRNFDPSNPRARGEQLLASNRSLLPLSSGMERYTGQADPDAPLGFHPNNNAHSSSPLSSPSPSSAALLSSSSSNSVPPILPPSTSQQWPPSMYGNSYYSPYSNIPSPGPPASQFSPAPTQPHHGPPPPPLHSHSPLAPPPPPLLHHPTPSFRRVSGQAAMAPFSHNPLAGGVESGGGDDVDNGGMPLSPTSISSSPAIASSSSFSSSSSSVSSHVYTDLHSSPNFFDKPSKTVLNNE